MKKQKIVFFVNVYKPAKHSGGPIYAVSRLAEGLVIRGYNVEVWTTRLFQEDKTLEDVSIEGIRVRIFGFEKNLLAKTGLPYFNTTVSVKLENRFWESLQQNIAHFDYAIICNTYFPGANRLAKAFSANSLPYAYYSAGELSLRRVKFRFLKKILYIVLFEKYVLDNATTLVCFTKEERTDYSWLTRNTAFSVVPNGIDMPPLKFDRDAVDQQLVGTYEKHRHASRFLYFGRVHPTKGPQVAIDALKQVIEVGKNSVLFIAGDQENASFQVELQSQIKTLDLDDRVIFLGCLSGLEKSYVLSASSALLAPTVAEGFSISILESLSFGLPVITTEGARFQEIESCGYIVSRSPKAFADAMLNYIDLSDSEKATLSSASRDLVATNYQWDKLVNLFIETVLSSRHAPLK